MKNQIKKLLFSMTGMISVTFINVNYSTINKDIQKWVLLASDVTTTVYNASTEQCNTDYLHTASMYTIDPQRIQDIRVLAMERTMMEEYKISYGTVVKIVGTGIYDGLWSVEDTMNKRFEGQHKIDLLVPSHIKYGKWENVQIFIPGNETTKKYCRNNISI